MELKHFTYMIILIASIAMPIALSFDKAMQGWDFLTYFKSTIESATGIFNNMSGNLQSNARTATELNYSVNGQATRLNMLLDAVNRKIIIPNPAIM